MSAVLHCHIAEDTRQLAFFSQKLTPTEQKYSTYDRELLAIYKAIKYFRHQLEGRNFVIYMDHRPLIFAFVKSQDNASPRQLRHLDFISQFSTEIRYIQGSSNTVADTLSRIQEICLPSSLNFNDIATGQSGDVELQNLITSNTTSLNLQPLQLSPSVSIYCDVNGTTIRPFISKEFCHQAFQENHSLSYPSVRATRKLLLQCFVWPSIDKDVAEWCRSCQDCQKSKSQPTRPKSHSNLPITHRSLPKCTY